MRQLLTSIILVSAVFFSACKKETIAPPTADFTASTTSIELRESVTFIDKSTNGNVYTWDFGEGGVSWERSPTYQFRRSGTHTVRLTVTNEGGSSTKEMTIQVKGYFLKSVAINSFPGTNWDPGNAINAPDIRMIMGPHRAVGTPSGLIYNTGFFVFWSKIQNNAVAPFTMTWDANQATSLLGIRESFTHTTYTAGSIELTKGDYYILFEDQDPNTNPATVATTPFVYQYMFDTTVFKGLINNQNTLGAGGAPVNFFSSNGTTATFGFSGGGWNVSMAFDVRMP